MSPDFTLHLLLNRSDTQLTMISKLTLQSSTISQQLTGNLGLTTLRFPQSRVHISSSMLPTVVGQPI